MWSRGKSVSGAVRKDVGFFIAENVETPARGEEIVAGLSKIATTFANEQGFEFGPQSMKMQDIRRCIAQLFGRQGLGAPIRCLLLLGQIDPQHFAA